MFQAQTFIGYVIMLWGLVHLNLHEIIRLNHVTKSHVNSAGNTKITLVLS